MHDASDPHIPIVAGWANIVRSFQITFTGSLVFGLVYLLLTDHDGSFDWRDWFGLLAGVLALMTSGVALVMVAVVGIAVLARRGRRIAVVHMVPLTGVYAVWFAVIGRKHPGTQHLSTAGIVSFVVRSTFACPSTKSADDCPRRTVATSEDAAPVRVRDYPPNHLHVPSRICIDDSADG